MWQIVERCMKDTVLVEMSFLSWPIRAITIIRKAFQFYSLQKAAVSDEITKKVDITYHLLKKDPL